MTGSRLILLLVAEATALVLFVAGFLELRTEGAFLNHRATGGTVAERPRVPNAPGRGRTIPSRTPIAVGYCIAAGGMLCDSTLAGDGVQASRTEPRTTLNAPNTPGARYQSRRDAETTARRLGSPAPATTATVFSAVMTRHAYLNLVAGQGASMQGIDEGRTAWIVTVRARYVTPVPDRRADPGVIVVGGAPADVPAYTVVIDAETGTPTDICLCALLRRSS